MMLRKFQKILDFHNLNRAKMSERGKELKK